MLSDAEDEDRIFRHIFSRAPARGEGEPIGIAAGCSVADKRFTIGAKVPVCADEEDRADFDQRS